jgi:hypothetical protein
MIWLVVLVVAWLIELVYVYTLRRLVSIQLELIAGLQTSVDLTEQIAAHHEDVAMKWELMYWQSAT